MATPTKTATTSPLRTIQSSNIGANAGKVLKNTKSFENFSYFLGGIDVTHQNLDKFTPYIRGVSRIFLHKPPTFMNKLDSQMTKAFKTYLETGYKAVSGIADIDVEFTTFEGGFAGQNFQTVQLARDNTESVTISVYELAGSPIREYLDTWVTGVRDPRSGIAHYHGLCEKYFNGDTANGLPYAEINHTAEFIYTTYDPTGLALEYACMFAHCFPRRVPKDHLNYESGNRDNVQMDIEFSTEKYESPAIPRTPRSTGTISTSLRSTTAAMASLVATWESRLTTLAPTPMARVVVNSTPSPGIWLMVRLSRASPSLIPTCKIQSYDMGAPIGAPMFFLHKKDRG